MAIGLSSTRRPRVGKTYLLKKTETQRDEEIGSTSTTTTEVTLNFKSARQMEVSIHQFGITDGVAGCDGTGKWTVKRQS